MDNRTMIGGGAPPPPSEVKVRTMRSDLESMAKSGGGMPRFEDVAVSGLSIEKESAAPAPRQAASPVAAPISASTASVISPTQFTQSAQPINPAASAPTAVAANPMPAAQPQQAEQVSYGTTAERPEPHKDRYAVFIVVVVALLAIAGVGYVAYITFFASSAPSTQAPQGTTPVPTATLPPVTTATTTATSTASPSAPATTGQSTGQTSPSLPAAVAELSTQHVSLFKKPADQVITINFGTTNASTYKKTMSNTLSTASAASTMIELNPKTSDGNNLSIQGLLSVAGAALLPSQTWSDFNPDATFFVYRDKNGLWPGYVIALNAGETTSSVAANVAQLESSNSIADLFLADPGTQSGDGFTDSIVSGISVRILPFTGLSIPSYFTYGWDGNYLILSTSQNGFGAAVADLQ